MTNVSETQKNNDYYSLLFLENAGISSVFWENEQYNDQTIYPTDKRNRKR